MQWIFKKKKKIILKRAIFCFEIVKTNVNKYQTICMTAR